MAKNIVLCSDGTGNRWGVGNQTNVSKLYEAVKTDGSPRQVRFYDNGVGTSSNKYLKAATGAFGFGLRQNVVDLYEFLARNWQPGDRIYMFGFSRGAATVRAFAGMLQECGLLWIDGDHPDCKCYDEERLDELIDLAMDAYRHRNPNKPGANRSLLERFWRSVENSKGGFSVERRAEIKMIGVWDTVSALGFPKGPFGLRWLFKSLEWLADRLFPHSFYNYRLDDRVELACHALAIDDERRTFRPMVWNEIDEPKPQRVEQVWFSGMHSDVGGGYPRSGLASASLKWMMAHARRHGLRLRPRSRSIARNDANPQGKMHDSRDGFGVFYRYMPRDLVRLCEEGVEGDEAKVREGEVKIHRSSLDRLHEGTARYAPGLLPRSFLVVDDPGLSSDGASVKVEVEDEWQGHRKQILQWTRRRSGLYHAFLYLSLALVAWTIVLWVNPPASDAAEAASPALGWVAATTHAVFGTLANLLKWALPKATEGLVDFVLVKEPFALVLLLGVAAALFGRRGRYFTGRDGVAQEARRLVLAGWAKATGARFRLSEVEGQAEIRPLRVGALIFQLLLVAFGLVLVVGAFRISFEGSPARPAVAAILKMVILPWLAFVVFAGLFRLTGRKAGKSPLNERKYGYRVAEVAHDWSHRDLAAEKRFLVVDLFFPLFYGAAFAASGFIGVDFLGWPVWIKQVIALVVVVTVVADWVENLVHLFQLRRFEKNKSAKDLQESWIKVASRATVLKYWGVVALAIGAVGVPVLFALYRALGAAFG